MNDVAGVSHRPLWITALVKQVPKGDHSGRLDADGRLERAGAVTEMNPWCRRAVAQAVRLAGESGGRSTAVTMGPPGRRPDGTTGSSR